MNVASAARILDMHPEHVKRLIRQGELVAEKDGARWDITEEAISDFRAGRRRRRQPMVYVLEADGVPGVFKIGWSLDPERRLEMLRVGSPAPLKVRLRGPGEQMLERVLHLKYAAKRLHGEWFRLDEDDVREIEKLLTSKDAALREAVKIAVDWNGGDGELLRRLSALTGDLSRAEEIMAVRAAKKAAASGTTGAR